MRGIGPGRIEDYALLSDLRTAALVSRDGSVDWWCLPRFDSPSCFSRLLGTPEHGRWRIGPVGEVISVQRRYRPGGLVLETEFRLAEGVVRLVDAMPPQEGGGAEHSRLVRILEGVAGRVEVELHWVLRFAYGDSVPWVRRARNDGGEHMLAVAGPAAVVLYGDLLPCPAAEERAHRAQFVVEAGDTLRWVMEYSPSPDDPPAPVDAEAEAQRCQTFWSTWSDRIRYRGPHSEEVRRSLITLKALTYAPTGGIVAAPTTSLPETFGGERNWDYRYCWLRDAALTLLALDDFGCYDEARAWREWLVRAVAGDPANLQIMYGISGERHLVEWEVDWLPGYHGARPVRVGNAAHRQLQLDVYGEVMDALHLARERGHRETMDSWAVQRGMMRHLEQIWTKPDKGLWEVRGPDRHFTHSRIMVWVAFDRAVRAVEDHGLPGPVTRWRELRDAVHDEVLDRGWNADLNSFTQYYGGTELDAATLLIPAVGFLPGDDPRMLGTLEAIGSTLKHGDLVDRYETGEGRCDVDGLTGAEGSFLACSFWFVDALAMAGRRAEAEAAFGRLVALVNDVGLLAEEYDAVSRRMCGNFPQAFSHLALVNSASVLYGGRVAGERSSRDRAVDLPAGGAAQPDVRKRD
ncbi:glycoside hydrolase family 15 protein [Lentzea sp. NPDC051208]|uniref:glycoside hydrolase family 15 protein n=1 Tax=Lentzea sp. NPDC051208 TaxID=3154642 RepID=UPI00343477AC